MSSQIRQIWPPAATFTEESLPDQAGKVFLVTGGATGIGLELVQILYAHNAKVYIAARSEEKASKAIASIETSFPESTGELNFLHLDLSDLVLVKKSAESFLSKETRLDVLWNNAGVMVPPQGSKTKQDYESQLGTNCLGPFLFTKLLTPLLVESAKSAPRGSVRVVWLSSSAAEGLSPKGGIDMTKLDYKKNESAWYKYGVSKTGNIFYSKEFARRHRVDGVVSVSLNPGFLKTELQRHISGIQAVVLNLLLHTPIHGAYTELFAGLSPEITLDKTGAWIIPWGRFGTLRKDIEAAGKTESEGGTGRGEEFWKWSEQQVQSYL